MMSIDFPGKRLPNVRLLSMIMQGRAVQSALTTSPIFTDITTHFGQFLAHEVRSRRSSGEASYVLRNFLPNQVFIHHMHLFSPSRSLQQLPTPTRKWGTANSFKRVSIFIWTIILHESKSPRWVISIWELISSSLLAPVCCHTLDKDSECHEIKVDHGDPFFEKGHCIELVRSQPYNNSETACLKNNAGELTNLPSNIRSLINVDYVFWYGLDFSQSWHSWTVERGDGLHWRLADLRLVENRRRKPHRRQRNDEDGQKRKVKFKLGVVHFNVWHIIHSIEERIIANDFLVM